MLEQFSATIEKLYAAAADANLWDEALGAIEKLSGSAGVVLNIVDRTNPAQSRLLNSPGIFELLDGTHVAEYNQEILPHCPRVAWGLEHADASCVCDYMILSEAEMDRNLAYDWYRRHGLRYFVGSPLIETPRYSMMWSLQRSPAQGHAQRAEIALVELLKPHVARAVSLADQLGTLESLARFSLAMFEASPNGLLALDPTGHIVFSNSRGETYLRDADGLCVIDGRLSARSPSEKAELDRLVTEATQHDGTAGGWTRVSRPTGGPPYAVFVAPLKARDEDLISKSARVLVIVHDTGEHRQADPSMLACVYGLTEAEARLASALSAGHSIESAAANLGIQATTARSQLKSVFRRVGVNRQQDLVRLITELQALR